MKNRIQNKLLRRCNELALRARGHTATNPNVGAIIYDNDSKKMLGEGWHKHFGGPHGEVHAIRNAKSKYSIERKTIAVSLEPCNHSGKTPACTDLIVNHKLEEVWIDQIDPDARMEGKSMEILRNHNISVPNPLNSDIGSEVIHPFIINTHLKRPYLILKMAISQDHFIGQNGLQVKISGELSNRWVHRLRNETQAIMTGTNTLINDNPSLTSRYGNNHQPLRILPDRRGILPTRLRVFKQGDQNIILTESERTDYPGNVIKANPHNLHKTFSILYERNIGSILIEGGSTFFHSLLEENLWDEFVVIRNNDIKLGHGIKAPYIPSVYLHRKIKLGRDTLFFLKNLCSR